MGKIRQQRVAGAIREELSELIQKELKDPRLGFASIVQVQVSKDLRHANVYVSVFGSDEEKKATLQALDSAKGFLKREIANRLRLRYAPELIFHADDSIEHGARIQELLQKLKHNE